jgi:hypothetical protein
MSTCFVPLVPVEPCGALRRVVQGDDAGHGRRRLRVARGDCSDARRLLVWPEKLNPSGYPAQLEVQSDRISSQLPLGSRSFVADSKCRSRGTIPLASKP